MSILKIPLSNSREHDSVNLTLLALVQYGDFQCEFCGEAYTAVKLLRNIWATS